MGPTTARHARVGLLGRLGLCGLRRTHHKLRETCMAAKTAARKPAGKPAPKKAATKAGAKPPFGKKPAPKKGAAKGKSC